MAELSAFMMVICDQWIDEVRGERCVLQHGHEGACSAVLINRRKPHG